MVFGSGVAGLSFLTHMHTPPWLTPEWQKNTHALAIRVPSIAVHSHAEEFFPVFHLHSQDFVGFTHAVVLFCGFVNSEAVSFTHGLIRGFCIVVVHAPVVRL